MKNCGFGCLDLTGRKLFAGELLARLHYHNGHTIGVTNSDGLGINVRIDYRDVPRIYEFVICDYGGVVYWMRNPAGHRWQTGLNPEDLLWLIDNPIPPTY